jgi:hypothetical protein
LAERSHGEEWQMTSTSWYKWILANIQMKFEIQNVPDFLIAECTRFLYVAPI